MLLLLRARVCAKGTGDKDGRKPIQILGEHANSIQKTLGKVFMLTIGHIGAAMIIKLSTKIKCLLLLNPNSYHLFAWNLLPHSLTSFSKKLLQVEFSQQILLNACFTYLFTYLLHFAICFLVFFYWYCVTSKILSVIEI